MNAILQHWNTQLSVLAALSRESISAYARRLGADYHLVPGMPVDAGWMPHCQKLCLLDPKWDCYDVVVMVDMDMFERAGNTKDIFAEAGYGWHQEAAHQRVCGKLPHFTSAEAPFWGGAIYRMPLALRLRMRAEMDKRELKAFDNMGAGVDEGMFHRLAVRAGISAEGAYFGKEWCWDSYNPAPGRAALFHIRKKPTGDKMENLRTLKAEGWIA